MNCFRGLVDQQKALALFPPGTNIRDSHHREYPTGHDQDLNETVNLDFAE